jgi:hypothetical protein
MLLASSSALMAQTGGQLPKASELAGGGQLTAAPSGDTIHGVDLRRYFPPVGNQTMNDCTAWATSAAKSCLEAFDQGWVPNRPQTMFSPTFIYPQINQGKDEGSSLVAAALLLQEMGAATLKTAPYHANDFLTQPPSFAFEEAGRFKNRNTYVLQNREEIKIALRENLPVLIGTRLTPPFFSGKAESYTVAMHRAGMAERQPDQPHAMHAMVIVGFDEPTERFLVRNSWGENWGRGGYCWVDYGVMDSIDASPSAETFLFLALAMEDEAMDAEATPDIGEDLKSSLSLRVRGEHAGYDSSRKETVYRLQAELIGPTAALELVNKVTWQVPSKDGAVQTLVAVEEGRRFRVISAALGEKHAVVGEVQFEDGSTKRLELETNFTPPTAKDRTLTFRYEDLYWGDGFRGDKDPVTGEFIRGKQWVRRVWIDGSMDDLRAIDKYTIESGGYSIEHEPNAGRASLGATYMVLTKPESIAGHFTFIDGTQLSVTKEVNAFEDPANDDVWIKSEIHPVGDGKLSAFRLFLRMPLQIEEGAMEDIVWELDGSQQHRNHRRVFEEWNHFEVTGSATRDFRARATISFHNGHAPIVVEKWIELPDTGTAYTTPLRVDVWSTSRYTGRNASNVPIWDFNVRLSGDWQSTEKVNGVKFRYTDLHGQSQTLVATKTAEGDWIAALNSLPSSLQLVAEVDFSEGPLRIEKQLHSSKPIVDGIFLENRTYMQWPRDKEHPDLRWTADLGGAQWFGGTEFVEYLYDARFDNRTPDLESNKEGKRLHPNHWRALFSREDGSLSSRAQIMRTAAAPGTVRTRVHYRNGHMEKLATKIQSSVTEDWRGSSSGAITVRTLESFRGVDIPSPFKTDVWLEGSEEALAAVDYMLFWVDGQLPNPDVRIAPNEHPVGLRSAPGNFRLRLVMKDDSIEEYLIEVSCLPQRFYGFQLSRSETLIGLQGPDILMESIKSATYSITSESGETSTLQGLAYANGFYDNAVPWEGVEPVQVQVEIQYKGGAKEIVEGRVALPQQNQPTLLSEDFFWGYEDGEPLWLLHHRVLEGAWYEGRAMQQLNMSGRSFLPSFAWPDFEILEVQPFLNHEQLASPSITIEGFDDGWFQLPPMSGYTMQSPELKDLSLTVNRTWEDPSMNTNASDEWQMLIAGPWAKLDEISSVKYETRFRRNGANYKSTWISKERYSLRTDGFLGLSFLPALKSVTATIHFLDGREDLILTWQAE